MHAPADTFPARRTVLERTLIRPWEYRHLRAWAGARFAVGVALTGLGVVTLGMGGSGWRVYGWTAAFLAVAAANVAFGYWEVNIAAAQLPQRVRELEQSRSRLVDDSAARLRQIERDLHDGAQAQMVAAAMKLGLARDKLGGMVEGTAPPDLERVLELVAAAHRGAKEAIAALRDLARGIHPPVLDNGLGTAVATLAARSDVPVDLRVDLPERPSAAIETIAYFCAAELLTNIAKHSGARQVTVELRHEPRGMLHLVVTDDGSGGARIEAGGGLAGLAQRVGTVGGLLRVSSPPAGPTVVTVELPSRV